MKKINFSLGSKVTACSVLALGLVCTVVQADTYPSQPIRLVVPFAPGGAVDQVARTIGPLLSKQIGQTVLVENRPGASGAIGAGEVARAKPDGYTLLLALDSQAVNHHIIKSLPFDTFKSFDYLSLLVTLPQVLVVRNDLPVRNLPEFVARLKANPGTVYGSAGTASAGHVNSATLSLAYNLQTTHAPYKGAGPLLTDLLGGHIDFAFAGLSVMLPHIKDGKIRAIALSSAKRNPALPDVPTMGETIPGFDIPTWVGIAGPAGMPANVRAKILAAVKATMENQEVRARLGDSTFNVVASSPEEFSARVKKDSDVMADLVKRKIIGPD